MWSSSRSFEAVGGLIRGEKLSDLPSSAWDQHAIALPYFLLVRCFRISFGEREDNFWDKMILYQNVVALEYE